MININNMIKRNIFKLHFYFIFKLKEEKTQQFA